MADPEPPTQGDRFTVDAEGTPLAEVVAQVSQQTGRNVLVAPGVEAEVSVTLREVPWRQGVDALAKMTRCDVAELPGGVLLLHHPPRVTIQLGQAPARTVLQLVDAYSSKGTRRRWRASWRTWR